MPRWARPRKGRVLFRDRADAGARLTQLFDPEAYADAVVLGLPRGGVPVAAELAAAIAAPLDVFVVRKLGVPGHEELAFGAVASGGTRVLNPEVVAVYRISDETIAAVFARESAVLVDREAEYRSGRPPEPVEGRTVILVDDGLATGASMRAAATAVRALAPARVCVAVPVGAAPTCEALRAVADQVVCAETPEPFVAVGYWYDDFTQVPDDEVRRLLAHERGRNGKNGAG